MHADWDWQSIEKQVEECPVRRLVSFFTFFFLLWGIDDALDNGLYDISTHDTVSTRKKKRGGPQSASHMLTYFSVRILSLSSSFESFQSLIKLYNLGDQWLQVDQSPFD